MEIAEESGLAADSVGFGKMGANRSVGIQVVGHLGGNDDIKRVVSERELRGGPENVSSSGIESEGARGYIAVGDLPLPALVLREGFEAPSEKAVAGSNIEDGEGFALFGADFADERPFERPGKPGKPIHPTEPVVGVADLGVGKVWGVQTFRLRCPFAKKHAPNKSIHAFRTSPTAWKFSGKHALVAARRDCSKRLVAGLPDDSTLGTDGGCGGAAKWFPRWRAAWGVDAPGIAAVIDGARHNDLRTVEHRTRIQTWLHGWSQWLWRAVFWNHLLAGRTLVEGTKKPGKSIEPTAVHLIDIHKSADEVLGGGQFKAFGIRMV